MREALDDAEVKVEQLKTSSFSIYQTFQKFDEEEERNNGVNVDMSFDDDEQVWVKKPQKFEISCINSMFHL